MLPAAQTYEQLVDDFRWNIPARYNMAFDVCDKWAISEPERTAIIDLTTKNRRDVSFGELKTLSDQLAEHLYSLGIERGDRVGVYRTQSVWTAAAHIAIWKLGAISIPLFKLFGEEALKSRLKDSGAKAVVTDKEGLQVLSSIQQAIPDLTELMDVDLMIFPEVEDFKIADTSPDDPAVLIYTSGTTGPPKGALHGHRILLGHLPGVEMSHDLFPQENDVIWTPADWAWIGGLFDVLMPGLYHGVPVVASRLDKFSPDKCVDVVKRGNVKNIFFPPTALKMLKAENAKIEGLRTVASGGEPLGGETLHWGKKALGVVINEFYGQTECNMVVSSCGSLFDTVPNTMGRPVPGHEVSVIDQQGRPTDEEGDIAVKRGTPVMMLEYWNNPKATKAKFKSDNDGNEWLLTGDRGIITDNAIQFVGRNDDVITSSGYRIGPAEIEDCLLMHPSVALVGVVGKPDPERTEIVKAYIVVADGYEANNDLRENLQDHVKKRLAKYEYPREIEFLTELPMTVTGKIIRKELKNMAIKELATKATRSDDLLPELKPKARNA